MKTLMTDLVADLRYALRQMRRAPGFAFVAVLTLALGVGAATAVFSVVDAVMLRPLPFDHPERVAMVQTRSIVGYTQPFSWLSYKDLRHRYSTMAAFAGYETTQLNLESPSGPVSLHAVRGTDNFFDVFAVKPVLGRTFLPGEDQAGHNAVAVLSYEVWTANFNADTAVIGKVVRLDGSPHTVVGVMPAGFRFPLSTRNGVYTPLHLERKTWAGNRGAHWMRTLARLKPGVTMQQAEAEFATGLNELARAYPDTDAGRTGNLQPMEQAVLGKTKGTLWTLVGAVAALLAIACVNVAGLLLARAVKREREVAMRAAVGASRARLLKQMVTESVLLAAMSIVVGVGLAYGLLTAMRTFLITALGRGADVHVNGSVLLAATVFAVTTAVVASLGPAVRLSGLDPNRMLKSGGSAGAGRGQHRLRASFIVAQVTLSLTLLIVAGLLLQTLSRAMRTELGFDPKRILALEIEISPGNYAGRDPVADFYTPLLARVQHLHGVASAGVINNLPIQSWGSNGDIHIAGQPPAPKDVELLAENRIVSQGYFDAMGIRLMGGRMLSPGLDRASEKGPTIVVNEAFQRKFFAKAGSPLGAVVDSQGNSAIVGVVTNVRQDLGQPAMAELDYLLDTLPMKERLPNMTNMTLVVRSDSDPKLLVPELRNALRAVDATVPFHTPELMTEVVSDQLVMERMESWLFGVFAAIAVTLAMIGLYGLISHEVEIGTRDIGVRMALGATRGLVMQMVLRRVLLLIVAGATIGLVLTFAMKRAIASVVTMQYERDGVVMAGLALLLMAMGVIAAWVPARRAASIEPMQALRSE